MIDIYIEILHQQTVYMPCPTNESVEMSNNTFCLLFATIHETDKCKPCSTSSMINGVGTVGAKFRLSWRC